MDPSTKLTDVQVAALARAVHEPVRVATLLRGEIDSVRPLWPYPDEQYDIEVWQPVSAPLVTALALEVQHWRQLEAERQQGHQDIINDLEGK
jgi:hypothetical protein